MKDKDDRKKITRKKRISKKSKPNYGGVAVFHMIGFFKNAKEADKFMDKKFKKTRCKYRIYRKEIITLWGSEYDKP